LLTPQCRDHADGIRPDVSCARAVHPRGIGATALDVHADSGVGTIHATNLSLHHSKETLMLDRTAMKFSHVKPGDTEFKGEGLRDFFKYRDLGIADATAGAVLAQLVTANLAPEKGTGWHYHGANFHIVLMLKGWARFMYEDKETLVSAGDCVHQRPGIVHFLFDYSPDMEYLEVVGPADFTTVDVNPGPAPVPEPKPWT